MSGASVVATIEGSILGGLILSELQASIERQALKLSRSDRAQIALHLLDSLEQDRSSASQDVIEQEWVEESVCRLEAYRRGDMESYPVEDVIADLERSAE